MNVLYIHYMFTVCSLYVHYMFTIYSLYIHYIFTIYSLYIHYIFTIYSLYIHYIFTIYSLYIHYIFTIYSLYIHHIFTIYSLYIPVFFLYLFSKHHQTWHGDTLAQNFFKSVINFDDVITIYHFCVKSLNSFRYCWRLKSRSFNFFCPIWLKFLIGVNFSTLISNLN